MRRYPQLLEISSFYAKSEAPFFVTKSRKNRKMPGIIISKERRSKRSVNNEANGSNCVHTGARNRGGVSGTGERLQRRLP